MRDSIIFRAKTFGYVEGDPWYYGLLEEAHDGTGYIRWFEGEGEKRVKCGRCINLDTVGQFTGMYDSQGKEIWEGDICSFHDIETYVAWDEEETGFAFYREDRLSKTYISKTQCAKIVNVIGNIYDDPDILDFSH